MEGLCCHAPQQEQTVAARSPPRTSSDSGSAGVWSQDDPGHQEDTGLGHQSLRFRAYIRAHQRLNPHRLVQPASLTMAQLVVKPLSHNLQVTEEGRPLTPTGGLLLAAQLGMTDVGASTLSSIWVGAYYCQ